MPQTRKYKLCGLGNAIVDLILEVSEDEFNALGFEKGTMRLVDSATQSSLLDEFRNHKPLMVSGGSVANSVIAFKQLGGEAAFITCLGSDSYGLHYKDEFDKLGITLANKPIANAPTGTSLVLITPDAERTMRTSLGISAALSSSHVDEEVISQSEWLFVEGYLLSNAETGQSAVRKAVSIAKQHGVKIALTLSEAWIVDGFRTFVDEIVGQADLVLANEPECKAFTGLKEAEAAFNMMIESIPGVVVTVGSKGAFLFYENQRVHVPAFDCDPIDLTGAGDMFAAATLYGISRHIPLEKTALGACYLAMQVIVRPGARIEHNVKGYWSQATGGR